MSDLTSRKVCNSVAREIPTSRARSVSDRDVGEADNDNTALSMQVCFRDATRCASTQRLAGVSVGENEPGNPTNTRKIKTGTVPMPRETLITCVLYNAQQTYYTYVICTKWHSN